MKLIFPTFAKITLGTGSRTFEDFQKDLNDRNIKYRKINKSGVTQMLNSPDFIPTMERKEVSVVIIEPRDMGFRGEWVEREDFPTFFERVIESGFSLCPHETGPQLFVQAATLPDELTIAMNPIRINNYRRVFGMMRTKPTRECYAGYSRDEMPILDYDERPIVDPGGPHLFDTEYYEDVSKIFPGGTSTDDPFAFIKEK